jgi:hypothetical protein
MAARTSITGHQRKKRAYDEKPERKRRKLRDPMDGQQMDEVTTAVPRHVLDIRTHIDKCTHCKFIKKRVQRLDVPTLCSWRNRRMLRRPRSARQNRVLEEQDDECHAMLNPSRMSSGIRAICSRLKIERLEPTIDCLATRLNAQSTSTKMYITEDEDFFSGFFECREFWMMNVAWAHPPHRCDLLIRTIRAYKRRHCHGFVCGPAWPTDEDWNKADDNAWITFARAQSGYKTEYCIGGRGQRDVYFPRRYGCSAGGPTKCQYNTIIVYFDFRE